MLMVVVEFDFEVEAVVDRAAVHIYIAISPQWSWRGEMQEHIRLTVCGRQVGRLSSWLFDPPMGRQGSEQECEENLYCSPSRCWLSNF